MILFKSCPKCRGDLGSDRDVWSQALEWVCVQCGFRPLLAPVLDIPVSRAKRPRLPRGAVRRVG